MNMPDLDARIRDCEPGFIRVIAERLGIVIQADNSYLIKAVKDACHKFSCSPEEYLAMLTTSPDNSALLEHLIAEITIGETYFFRDKYQMDLLANHLLPDIIASKRAQGNLSLRIWSAGCASGEEIYSITILLEELLDDIDRWKIYLLATDVNMLSLQKARHGHYSKWSMRSISDYYQRKYFTEHNAQYVLSQHIINRVDFAYLNLRDNTYPSIVNGTNAHDLIICRNVLIYFNQQTITHLMKKISRSLTDEGILILGASDPVLLENTDLSCSLHKHMVFVRGQPAKKYMPSPTPAKPVKVKKTIIPKRTAAILPQDESTDELNAKAKQAADIGQLDQALIYCQQSLRLDSTQKYAYFIQGLIYIELANYVDAENALRKTLYLDRKFVEGHFQLGLLLFKRGFLKEGHKCLQNALNIVNDNQPEDVIPGSQGLSYGHFAEILKAEIKLYSRISD